MWRCCSLEMWRSTLLSCDLYLFHTITPCCKHPVWLHIRGATRTDAKSSTAPVEKDVLVAFNSNQHFGCWVSGFTADEDIGGCSQCHLCDWPCVCLCVECCGSRRGDKATTTLQFRCGQQLPSLFFSRKIGRGQAAKNPQRLFCLFCPPLLCRVSEWQVCGKWFRPLATEQRGQ